MLSPFKHNLIGLSGETHLTPFLSLLSAQKGLPFFEQPGKSFAEMQIFVRSVDRVFAVNVNQDASLSDLKAAIEDIEFIPTGNIPTGLTINE
jgi:hypothetical protein